MRWVEEVSVNKVEHLTLDEILDLKQADKTRLKEIVGLDTPKTPLQRYFDRIYRKIYKNGEGVEEAVEYSPKLVGLYEKSSRPGIYWGHYARIDNQEYFGAPVTLEGEPWDRRATSETDTILKMFEPDKHLFITLRNTTASDRNDILLVYRKNGEFIDAYKD